MDSPLRRALTALANRQSLSEEQTAEVFGVVMSGEATPAQIGGLLMGLRTKGETPDELAGATRALRAAMVRVDASAEFLVDTCGTGGGTVPTFNISTIASFVHVALRLRRCTGSARAADHARCPDGESRVE